MNATAQLFLKAHKACIHFISDLNYCNSTNFITLQCQPKLHIHNIMSKIKLTAYLYKITSNSLVKLKLL